MRRKIDQNQNQIVEALRKAGAEWIPTSGDPSIGFDGIACRAGKIWLIEVKDGSKPPSKQRLTKGEENRKLKLERVGVEIHTVASVESALFLIGVM